jgi:hypothetical protein
MSGRRRRTGSGNRYVGVPHYLMKCPAFMMMTPNAKAVLLHIWLRHNGVNNGEISYACREAEEIGLSKDQAQRALLELVERGFLIMRRNSGFNMKNREARVWEITAEPCGNEPAKKIFMRWSPRTGISPPRLSIVAENHFTVSPARRPVSPARL